MRERLSRNLSLVSLVISITALVLCVTVVSGALRQPVPVPVPVPVRQAASRSAHATGVSSKPRPFSLLLLGRNKKFPASAIPTVSLAKRAKNAEKLDGMNAEEVGGSCPPATVDLGSWCLDTAPYPLTSTQIGQNNYAWASKKCVEEGGYLPTAAQLIGAANRVKLESTIHDSQLTATIPLDPTHGLKDQREMTATLVTTQAGSDAAGSEGVSVGSTGNPQTGEPNPVPQPAVPMPETLQYVTVYSNGQKGGFAGSEPVSAPENFRCAFNKIQGALNNAE